MSLLSLVDKKFIDGNVFINIMSPFEVPITQADMLELIAKDEIESIP